MANLEASAEWSTAGTPARGLSREIWSPAKYGPAGLKIGSQNRSALLISVRRGALELNKNVNYKGLDSITKTTQNIEEKLAKSSREKTKTKHLRYFLVLESFNQTTLIALIALLDDDLDYTGIKREMLQFGYT